MLASFRDVLPLAQERRLCLPAFDIAGGQPDFLLAALRACEAARCPAVLLVFVPTKGEPYLDLEALVELLEFYAGRSPVPVVPHLDHGLSDEVVAHALQAGLRSVMFDGSRLPLDENIARTRAMAELAHARGAFIEGELGVIGREYGGKPAECVLTDPAEAERFVRETGVDMLAPAVGNAHGFTSEEPRLRFDLIEELARRAAVPLSLHGGTGIPAADVRRAGRLGMCKINVASLLHGGYSAAITQAATEEGDRPFYWSKALRAGRDAVGRTVSEIIREFGVEGTV